jgi:hypothetical protein
MPTTLLPRPSGKPLVTVRGAAEGMAGSYIPWLWRRESNNVQVRAAPKT